jgi:hypothetical protein
VRIDLNASISRDQAIRIAENTYHFKGYTPSKVDARLSVGYWRMPQRLVWYINIICNFNVIDREGNVLPDHRGGEVIVDAKTGEVGRVNPCL